MNRFESQHTEWREAWHDDLLRGVCGFANAEGGRLESRRNNKGEIVGLADAPKLLEDLPNNKPNDLWLEFPFSNEYLEAIASTCWPQTDHLTEGRHLTLRTLNG